MRIVIDRDVTLTTDIMHRMITYFNTHIRGQLQFYKEYYDGNQAICKKSYADSSQHTSNIVTNYCKNIVETYDGYLGSYITYDTDPEIQEILRYNDVANKDTEYLEDALIYGEAHEIMYIDEYKNVAFNKVDPRYSFGIFANDLSKELLYFIRLVPIEDWQFVEQNKSRYLVYVYDNRNITIYKMIGDNGMLEFVSETPHYFNQCPANIFYLPDEKSIFDCVVSLQDAYNEALSDSVDDCSYFSDAYLVMKGCTIPGETAIEKKANAKLMRENRLFELPFDNADMSFLTKGNNATGNNELLNRIKENIYRIAQCPDFSDINFTNASSGVSLRYKLSNIETKSAGIETAMKKALLRRVELICGYVALRFGDSVWRDGTEIIFKRNVPNDTAEMISIVTALNGVVSQETLLNQIPFVKDVDAEIEKVREEKEENIDIFRGTMYSSNEIADDEQVEKEIENN